MRVATLDQAGNIVENTYDTGGRQTERSVTTLISGFDGAVKRIETSYLSRGLVDKVKQFDDPSAGTETDRVSYAYDGWGNVTSFTQDPDAIGSGRAAFSTSYSYTKHTPSGAPATVRRDGMSVPGLPSTSYEYWSSSNILDDAANRVTIIRYNINQQTRYYYNGVAQLVGTDLNVANAQNRLYTGTTAYANLDNFDRVIESPWYSTGASHNFIDEAFTYDRDSNITTLVDGVHTDGSGNHVADAVYTMDNLNRLTQTRTGKIVTGAISSGANERHEEVWVLDQQGNAQYQLDLTGDNSFSDPGEQNDTRTYSAANELLTRDLDSTPGTTGNNYTLTYDDNGNQTSDGSSKKYVWDAFGRLRKVTDLSSNLIAEYGYNGLGYRTMWWYDTTRSGGGDPDGTVDSNDPKYFFCYDDRWRVVATFRYLASDGSSPSEDPKEAFVYQNAGLGGYGRSSYIDDVVIRGSDDTGWVNLSDGIGDFNYYCQDNIRHDVVAMLYSDGELLESEQYTSNGRPEGDPVGDVNGDFVYDATDDALITGVYAVTKDTNLDGVINASDVTWASHPTGTYQALGLDVLSSAGVMNRKGYCGYESDPVTGNDLARHRWLDNGQGRWLSRDSASHNPAIHLYDYVSSDPIDRMDRTGQWGVPYMSLAEHTAEPVSPFPIGDGSTPWGWRLRAKAGFNLELADVDGEGDSDPLFFVQETHLQKYINVSCTQWALADEMVFWEALWGRYVAGTSGSYPVWQATDVAGVNFAFPIVGETYEISESYVRWYHLSELESYGDNPLLWSGCDIAWDDTTIHVALATRNQPASWIPIDYAPYGYDSIDGLANACALNSNVDTWTSDATIDPGNFAIDDHLSGQFHTMEYRLHVFGPH